MDQSKFPEALRDAWKHVKALDESGQSETHIIERRADRIRAVLKIAKATPSQRARLKREIAVLDSLDHPAVVRLLAHDLDAESPWLVTPAGVPLPRFRRKHVGDPEDVRFSTSRRIALSLLDGLEVVHRAGIVHRDIKPDNIVLFDEGARPAMIDFGLAFAANQQRLTQLDGRAVANSFAAPPAAYYGQTGNPKAWWDCLGIAWLWGWMLAEGKDPKHERFHWRYHKMIDHPDAEKVRALVAVCTDEETAPANAGVMLTLISQLGLRPEASLATAPQETGFEAIAKLANDQQRISIMRKQTRREQVDACASALAIIYEDVRRKLKEVAARAKAAGVPLRVDFPINDNPIAIALSVLKDDQRRSVELFKCEGTRHVSVPLVFTLHCEYRPFMEDSWPLCFVFQMKPGPDHRGCDVIHLTDGTPRADWMREQVDNSYYPNLFEKWLKEESHWEPDIF